MRIKEILKRGTWLYGGTVTADVSIVRQNYFEGPAITDEAQTPRYPATDADGCFYVVSYEVPGAGKGASGPVFACAEDAIRHAETTLKSPINWEMSEEETWETWYFYFLRAVIALAEDARETCASYGHYNVAWEIVDDLKRGSALWQLPKCRLSEGQIAAISELIASFDVLPQDLVKFTNKKEQSLANMEHPAWTPLRFQARRLIELLAAVTAANEEYFRPSE